MGKGWKLLNDGHFVSFMPDKKNIYCWFKSLRWEMNRLLLFWLKFIFCMFFWIKIGWLQNFSFTFNGNGQVILHEFSSSCSSLSQVRPGKSFGNLFCTAHYFDHLVIILRQDFPLFISVVFTHQTRAWDFGNALMHVLGTFTRCKNGFVQVFRVPTITHMAYWSPA